MYFCADECDGHIFTTCDYYLNNPHNFGVGSVRDEFPTSPNQAGY